MWISDVESFAAHYSISVRKAQHFQCTGEHLVAHSEGGKPNSSNIVAACKFCNIKRHARKRPEDPVTYALHVQRRLKKGFWNNHLLNLAARPVS
ncbi:HNH endonuclease [Marinobacter subterrani]|uniref:HNH endonuclease n=1 Tax=Marinobacter subterrani TaxID=1658765 RepID=UPI003B5B33A8